ncbi:alpha-amylase family protein [Silicimonas sp. MF1-12-2]|uniref:alpha-amylase family protein n=1 Tax=Silicimonas sp. MF1-12-2 TaxID=3384793 RepID=UPI0039B47450
MAMNAFDSKLFELRFERSRRDLFDMLERLYGRHPDYVEFRNRLEDTMRAAWSRRPRDLKWLDLKRDLEPDWFQRPDMVGYVFYIDRFAGDLSGVLSKLDYLEEIGANYVHFMPCLKPRPGDSDGGYSVMDYRAINPAYGTMRDFEKVAKALRNRGISLCVDMVLNHTAREHDWAKAARGGDTVKQDYYLIYGDRTLPDAYEKTLVEIFPDTSPGSFTFDETLQKWVWTTFNTHQWDLNWANPQVFLEIVDIMFYLANKGVDVLRLDAVAFMWKRMGTRCQSEPEVHMILQALRAACHIVCPAVIHLEEAIVSPQEMLPYLGRGAHDGKEGNLAYHNSLMVQFWSALAARDTALMSHVLRTHFPSVLRNATYATYIRCHDDIGWAITEQDAEAVGVTGPGHRSFLSDFYEGVFPGSFSRGALFGVNPETGDKRISGSFASLAGLEIALADGDAAATDNAVERIVMGHVLIAAYGGVPLIYMGDEIAMLNDYGYVEDPDHAHDSRWLHRPRMDWDTVERVRQGNDGSPEARVWHGVRHAMARRKATPELHAGYVIRVPESPAKGVFALVHEAPTGSLLCLFNFTETTVEVPGEWALAEGISSFHDALSDHPAKLKDGNVVLAAYGRVWLR